MLAVVLATMALAATPSVADDSAIRASVSHPDRPAADVARDPGRKPAEVMHFFGLREGARVIEIGAGGGYYTELLSRAVGDEGYVYAYNPFLFLQFIADELEQRFAQGRFKNVGLGIGSLLRLDLRDDAFDAAYIINVYHDIYYDEATGEAMSQAAVATLREVRRILRPGGIVGVVDHRAVANAGRADAAGVHRITEDVLIQDFKSAGFSLVGTSDVLSNPADDRTQPWFSDGRERDTTDRMVLRFQNAR